MEKKLREERTEQGKCMCWDEMSAETEDEKSVFLLVLVSVAQHSILDFQMPTKILGIPLGG